MRVLWIASFVVVTGGGSGSSSSMSSAATNDPNVAAVDDDHAADDAKKEHDACQAGQPSPQACDPADTKKTTVCHIPPGNPANAHTICVGNPAVKAHLAHGDSLGVCVCPPPPPSDGGVSASPDLCSSGGPLS